MRISGEWLVRMCGAVNLLNALETVPGAKKLGWGRLARELATLEAAAWRKLTVGGAVEPSHCSFSSCPVGSRLVLFGGEGVNMQPMNDAFVLDLHVSNPEWRHVKVTSAPPSRWGVALLSCFNGSWLVVFGGCGTQGLLNVVFILDLDAQYPAWHEISGLHLLCAGHDIALAPLMTRR